MRRPAAVGLLVLCAALHAPAQASPPFDAHAAERFAKLALACVDKEYPNKIQHVLNSDADVAPPRRLSPAFYGCYDWHSSVHGHWLLVRLARTFPGAPFVPAAIHALERSLTAENLRREAAYLERDGNAAFERPYGLAWLLMLAAELREWRVQMDERHARGGGPQENGAAVFAANLAPLEQAARARLSAWLPKLTHPVRSGEHSQTAFALGLLLDYARITADPEFEKLLAARARAFFERDRNCPLAYEPSGEDFLSPCLAEADVMRRVLAGSEYEKWLAGFLPQVPASGSGQWLKPAVVADRADPKLAHLDGLNLSRAWMLEGIASGLPAHGRQAAALRAAAQQHAAAGLAAVTGEHYEGGHWLGSFAAYLTTRRGMPAK